MTSVDMRILGLALVVASLVLGGGGVAYRSHAGEQFGMTRIDDAPQLRACGAPKLMRPLRMQVPSRASGRRVINLSTRGYNYLSGSAEPTPPLPASASD